MFFFFFFDKSSYDVLESYHFLVVGVEGLLDQRELLAAELPVGVDELGKLER